MKYCAYIEGTHGCRSVRTALSQAECCFWATFRFQPAYGFMRRLPHGVENGQEFEDLILLEANWMLDKYVAVGGRR